MPTDLVRLAESILMAPYGGVKCKPVVCPYCRGSGYSSAQPRSENAPAWRCWNCAGRGEVLTEGGEA